MKPLVEPYPAANVVWLEEVVSTNELAERLAREWDPEAAFFDSVIVADRQSRGRGRDDRRWESPKGGVYATWTGVVSVTGVKWVPMAAAVAAAAAIERAAPEIEVGLKWPNDLLVSGRKVGGVLSRARIRGRGALVHIGVGVNVDVAPPVERDPGGSPPSFLRGEGYDGGLDEFRDRFLADFPGRLRRSLDGAAAVREPWSERCVHRQGERIRVRTPEGPLEGTFMGLGPGGELEVRVDGATRSFTAVDVLDEHG